MELPSSLCRDISPPRASKRRRTSKAPSSSVHGQFCHRTSNNPPLAAVEAGKAKIKNHLVYFKHHFANVLRSTPPEIPRLSISDFANLYTNNEHTHGHHFVIHQHNHPKAGVHYDLRLQFSTTSAVSWALPKGLPGNPNSKQLGRMAVETRVHNLWNNLIESASVKTGSLLIWDTGTYSVLSDKKDKTGMPSPQTTDDESDRNDGDGGGLRESKSENEKLVEAFKSRYIRLRLYGTRLPKNYTITLRLPSNNDVFRRPTARRKKIRPNTRGRRSSCTSDSDSLPVTFVDSQRPLTDTMVHRQEVEEEKLDTDSEDEEDALTRSQNAYPGSTNDIGSVHQRRWFVLLDRQSSGFESQGRRWTRRTLPNGELAGFDPFVVRGKDHERSVITGRLARDIESDEGCEGYVGRGGWKSIES